MSDQQQPPTSEPEQAEETIPLAQFLESVSPGQDRKIATRVEVTGKNQSNAPIRFRVQLPEIQLHCPSDTCNRELFFRVKDDQDSIEIHGENWNYDYVSYQCSNCQKLTKIFALGIKTLTLEPGAVHCYKVGEVPPYGPPTASRLISLLGPGRELFLKGRRCEIQGLGIGAFVYYRRVIEDQKNRILAQIIKVAQEISAPPEAIAALQSAQNERQFSRAIDNVKDAIPQRLLINGQNPLTLLHAALSRGLHNHTDENCLELATDIRLILAELAELLSHALKDERELKEAVARISKLPVSPPTSK